MTTSPAPPPSAPAPRPRRGRRVVALVLGLLLLLPGLTLLGTAGAVLAAHWTNRSDGFVVTPQERFSSEGHALVSEGIDLRDGAQLWTEGDWFPLSVDMGTLRLEATGSGTDELFIGVASVADASAYLDGVQRTVILNLGFEEPASSSDHRPGAAPSGPPTEQDFWVAETTGGGRQQLTWDASPGSWMFVVMNADGSPGVDVRARLGAEFPRLAGIGWALLVLGVVVTTLAVVLLVRAIRRPADLRPPAAPDGVVLPSARPPTARELWNPPSAAAPDAAREGGTAPEPDGRTVNRR